jgi:hypothetical protein
MHGSEIMDLTAFSAQPSSAFSPQFRGSAMSAGGMDVSLNKAAAALTDLSARFASQLNSFKDLVPPVQRTGTVEDVAASMRESMDFQRRLTQQNIEFGHTSLMVHMVGSVAGSAKGSFDTLLKNSG